MNKEVADWLTERFSFDDAVWIAVALDARKQFEDERHILEIDHAILRRMSDEDAIEFKLRYL